MLSYHRVRGLYFPAVVFAATIYVSGRNLQGVLGVRILKQLEGSSIRHIRGSTARTKFVQCLSAHPPQNTSTEFMCKTSGSSSVGQDSLSHHGDHEIGVYVIDRFV